MRGHQVIDDRLDDQWQGDLTGRRSQGEHEGEPDRPPVGGHKGP